MDSVIAFKYNGPLGYCQSYKNEWCRLLSSLKYGQLPGWQMNGQGGMLRLKISDGCSWPLATVFEPECRESDQLNVDNADMLLVNHLVHFCQNTEYYTNPSRQNLSGTLVGGLFKLNGEIQNFNGHSR